MPPKPITPQAHASRAGLSANSQQQLKQLADQDRLRQLRTAAPDGRHIHVNGKRLLNLAGNDYLGLSNHPRLIDAAVKATQRFGVGSGASRLVSGTQPLHEEAEQRFAAFKHAEAALLLPTGYAANLAVLTTLAGPGDLVLLDKLVHASLIDAARASGAEVRSFPHLNLRRAQQLLAKHSGGRRLLVTDSVFSMDGDCADLPALCDLADSAEAVLIIDEAHATGVLGEDGSGLASAQRVAERVYTCGAGGVVVSTASKALGGLGGLVTAQRPVIDLLINKARHFIYSTAGPPAQAASITAALDVIRDEPQRRARLAELSTRLRRSLGSAGWPMMNPTDTPTPILPLLVGSEQAALKLASHLDHHGIYAPAIRPPTVAPGLCRVRLSPRADLADPDIDRLIHAVGTPPREEAK